MSRVSRHNANGEDYWLARPATIQFLWKLFIASLVLVVLGDLAVEHHPTFGIDGTFGFGAWFGAISCVVLIAAARAIGVLLKRPDTYYDK